MEQSARPSRVAKTGDFIIRHFPDSDEWRCWLIGASDPYTNIVGRGKFPLRAIEDWNGQALDARQELRRKEADAAPKVQRKKWWRPQ